MLIGPDDRCLIFVVGAPGDLSNDMLDRSLVPPPGYDVVAEISQSRIHGPQPKERERDNQVTPGIGRILRNPPDDEKPENSR